MTKLTCTERYGARRRDATAAERVEASWVACLPRTSRVPFSGLFFSSSCFLVVLCTHCAMHCASVCGRLDTTPNQAANLRRTCFAGSGRENDDFHVLIALASPASMEEVPQRLALKSLLPQYVCQDGGVNPVFPWSVEMSHGYVKRSRTPQPWVHASARNSDSSLRPLTTWPPLESSRRPRNLPLGRDGSTSALVIIRGL